ncbi:MAG: LytR C-terminal domain-containing protein [bacterium]|nr:LytR C-terminal domain-containing protein [bacterium]
MAARKRIARDKKKSSWLKPAFWAFVFLALIFSVGFTVNTARKAIWDGRGRINIVIDARDIYFLSFSPKEKKLLVVQTPQNVYIEAPHGFGSYPFGAIYDLGELEKKGGETLMLTAREFFAAPVGAWMKLPQGQLEIRDSASAKKELGQILRQSFLPPGGGIQLKSNLTIVDQVRLWWAIKQVRADKVSFLNLEGNGIFSDLTLADESSVLTPNLSKLDSLLSPFLAEEGVRDELLKIEILNSTGEAGLGNRVSRIISNLGGEVISIDNQEEKVDRCLIRVRKEEKGRKTAQRLQEIFNCNLTREETLESRVDLIFVVGRDYWQQLTKGER